MTKRFALILIVIVSIGAAAGANTLSGTVRFQDLDINQSGIATPGWLPARGVLAQFARVSAPGVILGQVRTAADGTFTSPDIGAWADVILYVQANGLVEGQTIIVRDHEFNTGAVQAYAESPFDISAGNVDAGNIDIDIAAATGAFNIIDALSTAWQHVRNDFHAAAPADTFTITCRWNDGDDPTDGTTYFVIESNLPVFHVLGDETVDADAFDDDVLQHEYGHFLQWYFSRDDSPGGNHVLGENLDIRLAFSEGWGNAFSCMISDKRALADPEVYVDTSSGLPLIVDFDNVDTDIYNGCDDEVACSALIWDIYNNEANYAKTGWTVADSTKAIWKIFDEYLPNTQDISIEDFWDGWFVYGFGGNVTDAGLVRNFASTLKIEYYIISEPNNTMNTAESVTVGGGAAAHNYYFDDDGDNIGDDDVDWFSFSATKALLYEIKTQNLTNACDTTLQLYKGDGTLITTDDDGGGNLTSRIEYTAGETATYYVRSARATKALPVTHGDPPGAIANYGSYEIVIALTLPSTDPPEVVNVDPLDGSTNVSIKTDITVEFTKEIDPTTVTASSFILTEEGSLTPIAATITVDATNKSATLNPDNSLSGNTVYNVALLGTIADTGGRALTAFLSQFTTGTGTPSVGAGGMPPKVPYARAASGNGYIDIEWWNPAGDVADVIIAVGTTRFPTLALTLDAQGNANFVVQHGQEVYRGTDRMTMQIPVDNGSSRFIRMWAVNGANISPPINLSSRASRGGRGLGSLTLQPGTVPEFDQSIPKVRRFRAAPGSGFIDLEWDVPAGAQGVIVAAGTSRHPQLQLTTNQDGTTSLAVADGIAIFTGTDRVSGRISVDNGSCRFFNIWSFNGIRISRPLTAESRAVAGGTGITADTSLYGVEPESLTSTTTTTSDQTTLSDEELQQLLDLLTQQQQLLNP